MIYNSVKTQIFTLVSKISGHNLEDLEPDLYLESDLGLDSIKTIELLNGLIQLIPEEKQNEFLQTVPMEELIELQTLAEIITIAKQWLEEEATEVKESSTTIMVNETAGIKEKSSVISQVIQEEKQENIQIQVFTLVSKISGHNLEDLEPDLYLESDLGLDSIKTIELLNGLIQLISEEKKNQFLQTVPMEELIQLQTLAEIIAIAEDWLEDSDSIKTSSLIVNNERFQKITTPLQASKSTNQKPEAVDIIDSQYIFLATHEAVSSCSVCSTVCLEGKFDAEIAQQSWQELILRHPMLRAYFSVPDEAKSFKDYQLLVSNNLQVPELLIRDLQNLDSDEQESYIQEAVNQAINTTWDIQQWPLHRFFAFRLDNSRYELGLTHHHIIADGLSNQIILQEFLEIYGAKIKGIKAILPPSTNLENYYQQVKNINDWQDTEAETLLENYLSRQGKDKFFWNPEKKELPKQTAQVCNLRYRLEPELTQELLGCASDWRLSLNTLLVGAYLQAISRFSSETKPIILNTPTSGRTYTDVDVTDMVGCFAENLALTFPSIKPNENEINWLQSIQSEIQSALALQYDHAQTRQMGAFILKNIILSNGNMSGIAVSLIRTAIKSNLYLSNIGKTHIKSEYGSLRIVDYRSATVTNAGCIDTLAEIFNDTLYLNTNYDSNFFSESFINSFLRQVCAELKRLVCLSHEPNNTTEITETVPQNPEIEAILQEVISQVCHLPLKPDNCQRDLEADLGIDSLEMIRIITKLEKQLHKKLDRQALLPCRSLQEMARVLSSSTGEVSNIQKNESLNIPYLAIAQQVKRSPDAVAILDGDTHLTYQELHRISNQVAHYLRKHGVKRGDLIGIMTERTPLLWVGILGILKAGAAYVPIDPTYPQERICYMLNHAEIGMLLTESQLSDKLDSCVTPELPLRGLVFLDEGTNLTSKKPLKQANREIWSQESAEDLPIVNDPDDLMVVLYTSGSTGRPKGVMLNHQGYMNRLQWMQKTFELVPGDRVVQKTSCCFDISIWEIFWPLMVGATVCPIQKELLRDPWTLAQWLNDQRINIMHFVPSLFGEFLNALEEEDNVFPHLRWLIFSGEALPIPFIQTWLDRYGNNTGLANLYGPTETSIDVSYHLIKERPGDKGETSIPIGKAIDNVSLRILDENRQTVAPGELGELWIGGIQLAKGYLKDPERTAKAFCPNPFPEIPGEHLYRTGDLAKQLPDGSFEYHGRIDHQVKIRGFRIELGEIERILLSHKAINEAAVVVLDGGEGQKRLVSVLAGSQVDVRQMKEYLGQKLPDYMIPHQLEWLPSLPKNHNGKLDRKALLDIISGEKVAPETPTKINTLKCLPLGPAQRWLIRYFEAPYQWTGYTRCLYHQPLDFKILNQALNCLVQRHWSLRTIFIQREGQWWQQEIDPQEPLQVILYDGSHLTVEQRNTLVHQKIQELAQEFRIDTWPLIKILIIKINDNCYDMNTIGHHIIGDLLTNQVLFREFWFIYSQILGNNDQNIQNLLTTPSYADYVSYLMEEEKQGNLESHLDYWKSQFPSPKSVFQVPLDQQLGTNLETSAASEWFTLSKKETTSLLTQAKKYYGCNVYHLLLAPLYRLMSQWSSSNDVVLSHRSHSRNLGSNHQFFSSVGNFATNFPLEITVDAKETWKSLIRLIKSKLADLPMNGSTFDWVGEQLPSYLYPDNHITPVRANYFLDFGQKGIC